MIEQLVKDLPEVYQPIFGRPEFSQGSSRACEDRLVNIKQIYLALQKIIGRPLRVLDLGCAQGYFSFHLAEMGASVQGIDYLDKNTALCAALAEENPGLDIKFSAGRIEDIIESLQPNQFDLVLGLSVFHHIVHEHGTEAVKLMLKRLANLSGAVILEMALQKEPLYWGPSQPDDPRELIDGIGFVHLLAHHGTHLANIPRPLYFASECYWLFDEHVGKFDSWSFESHRIDGGTHEKSRRYFSNNDYIIKQYKLNHQRGSHNLQEYLKEINFLIFNSPGFEDVHLLTHGQNEIEAWVVYNKIPGQLLLDCIINNISFDANKVILGTLEKLCILESRGLYHNDVRTWNIILNTQHESIYLIDYGSISDVAIDCAWPGNLYMSFLILVKEIIDRRVDIPSPLRSITISPASFSEPYKSWAENIWSKPVKDWSFRLMYETLKDLRITEITTSSESNSMGLWMKAVEEAVQVQKLHTSNLFNKAEAKAQQAQEQAMQAEAKAQQAQDQATQAEAKAQQAQAQAQAQEHAQQAQAALVAHMTQLHAVYSSTSWRITAPLRWVVHQLRLLRDLGFKQRAKAAVKKVLRKVVPWLVARPKLKNLAAQLAIKLGLADRLKSLVRNLSIPPQQVVHQENPQPTPADLTGLTPRARHIYHELKQSIESNQKGMS